MYNVEEDPTNLAPPRLSPLLSPSSSLQLHKLELELEDLEGPLHLYLDGGVKP